MDLASLLNDAWKIVNKELFKIGDTPMTLASILLFVVLVIAFGLLASMLRRFLVSRLLVRMQIADGVRYTVQRVIYYITWLLGILISFQIIGVDLSGLMVVFGLLSVGIGFGLQNITSNFISGLIILFERPIQVGDRVTIGDTEGDVIAINMRATTIRSLNNISIIVPNLDFVSSQVINWSHMDPKVRLVIPVGVAYSSDLATVQRCLLEIARDNPRVLSDPAPDVMHAGFGDSAWDIRLRVWIDQPNIHPLVRSEINCAIVQKFRENNIEIPFPQRDVYVRSSLQVQQAEMRDALGNPAPSRGE